MVEERNGSKAPRMVCCYYISIVIHIYFMLKVSKQLVANPCFARNVWGAQKSHGCGQSVHGKSQNFLKHNVSCKSFWVIQAHSKS